MRVCYSQRWMKDFLDLIGDEDMPEAQREQLFLDVWRLALPPDWEFEDESEPLEITDKLRAQIAEYARSVVRGTSGEIAVELRALLHRYESLYHELGRRTAEEFIKFHRERLDQNGGAE